MTVTGGLINSAFRVASTPGWVDRLRLMAAEAMARYEAYQRLLEDLHGEVKPRPALEKNED